MSSKKAARRKRQEQKEQKRVEKRGGTNAVKLFIVGIGAAVLITVAAAAFLVDRSDRGEPPVPGATWSEAHGHWH